VVDGIESDSGWEHVLVLANFKCSLNGIEIRLCRISWTKLTE